MTTNSKIKINMDSLKTRRDWKRFKVKDGHNIFRILPPFGEASNGYPYRKWQIIWGLLDPESGRGRPFASSMTSEKHCPVNEYVGQLEERAEAMKAELQTMGMSDEGIKARMKQLNELINELKPKTVYVYNAADKSGEVGLLELKSTAHKAMKREMNQYIQDYNQDPTSLNSVDDDAGVWFDITRQGLGRDTEYDVKKSQSKVKGPNGLSYIDDRSPLSDAVVENYDKLAYDLSSIYQVKTYDELRAILDANMPSIVEAVPDADLSVDPVLEFIEEEKKIAAPTKPVLSRTSTKIQTRLDDEDEETVETKKPAATTQTRVTAAPTASTAKTTLSRSAMKPATAVASKAAVIDDDFMAEAEAILNDR
jgi:hypothetical protein